MAQRRAWSVPGIGRGRPPQPAGGFLLVSADPSVVDAVTRVAGAVGVSVTPVVDVPTALDAWAHAGIVLVGSDRLRELAAAEPPRRPGVVVVASASDDSVWRLAVEVGAEHVICLPEGEEWLGRRLATQAEGPSRQGAVVAVVGGSGGVGTSTLAAGLALSVPAAHTSLLLDLDPCGGGIDLVVGAEELAGRRWSAFAATRGRLGVDTLRAALPQVGNSMVLAFDRDDPRAPDAPALQSVLDAAVRGCDLVAVDLPRPPTAAALVLARAERVLLVAAGDVRGAAAAASLLPWLPSDRLGLVVRNPSRIALGLPAETIADALGVELVGELSPESAVADAALRGDPPPLARGRFGRLCRRLVHDLVAA